MKGLRFAIAAAILATALGWVVGSKPEAPPPVTVASRSVGRPTPPRAPAAAERPGSSAPARTTIAPARTTIAVLRVGRAHIDLVSWVTKPVPFDLPAGETGATRYVLEDARTGVVLATGPCPLPRLCECDGSADHARGCVRVRHEAVVRLKLPRVAPSERLTIIGPDGPIARFDLEGA